jgi:hypothetical protein
MGYALKDRLHEEARLDAHVRMVRESGWTPGDDAGQEAASTLQPHQQRVVDEKRDLDERLQKLMTFTCTPTFAALPRAERDRLADQADIMAKYSEVLGMRIAAFAPAAA